jgi:hypothetical protein
VAFHRQAFLVSFVSRASGTCQAGGSVCAHLRFLVVMAGLPVRVYIAKNEVYSIRIGCSVDGAQLLKCCFYGHRQYS